MRYKSEQHRKWHRKVEGQIRDCMKKHPAWFAAVPDSERNNLVVSLAKRIVGEILADDTRLSADTVVVGVRLGDYGDAPLASVTDVGRAVAVEDGFDPTARLHSAVLGGIGEN